ncbi:MAG: nickel transporter [Hyphomicrobium sp.]|jgi:ABC-type nickel/cobalt efflux system permease component RcnA|nr:nickel transporter [Hyphomicrobium sp.]PPD07815.1 MAG: nickel transporter [Hyphomicrobium sp.]
MIARIAALLALVCLAGMLSTSVMAAPDAATGTVLAQATPDRALTAGRPAPGAPAAEPGMFAGVYNWLLTQQQRLNRELANAVKDLKEAGSITATLVLGFIGFSYGVLHAAGPGHGKAIISSYVLANRETVRRGIMLSFLSAFIQALSAIVLVGILFIVLNKTSMEMSAAERWIETISWAFVAAVGAWLLVGQVRQILARRSRAPAVKTHTHARAPAAAAPDHTHVHTHDCGCDHHHHEAQSHNHHAHDHDDCCGHAHMPDPSQLQGDMTWGKALAIAFSVGIRPCTGAILVLVFALSQGLLWAGVFATFAMAIGTAITVSVLATLAVGSRDLAARFGGEESGWATLVADSAGLIGASLVLLMGAVFFMGSLQPQAPF